MYTINSDTRSERDVAWFEEVAEAVERGRAALRAPLAHRPVSLCRQACKADTATTANLLIELARSGNAASARCGAVVHRAINELLETQNRDGGWGAATGRVLEALGHFGFRMGQAPVNAGVQFLLACQDESGAWYDLQTTWQAIAGLRAVGYDVFALPVRRAVRWLKDSQNADGDWGDSTAYALLALLAADEGESAEARAGAEFLVGTQRADGDWEDAGVFALTALERYRANSAR